MVTIGRYRFEGPVYNKAALKDAAGVYTVLDDRGNQRFDVLDVGESVEIRTRMENHEREPCWLRNRRGRICYAALLHARIHQGAPSGGREGAAGTILPGVWCVLMYLEPSPVLRLVAVRESRPPCGPGAVGRLCIRRRQHLR